MFKYYGKHKNHSYFEGWYFKQQGEDGAVALIPAIHTDSCGRRSASLQVITPDGTDCFPYPAEAFQVNEKIRLGDCWFSEQGIYLQAMRDKSSVYGQIQYSALARPAYDITGPFQWVPFMQCRHGVYSMYHAVDGELFVNGKPYHFHHGTGYIEGDRGRAFPRQYLWTQCTRSAASIMFSAAQVPLGGVSLLGCIGFIYYRGKEQRFATYLGGKVAQMNAQSLVIVQGDHQIEVRELHHRAFPLHAPQNGDMGRIVHEGISSTVHYLWTYKGKVLLDLISPEASFEYGNITTG